MRPEATIAMVRPWWSGWARSPAGGVSSWPVTLLSPTTSMAAITTPYECATAVTTSARTETLMIAGISLWRSTLSPRGTIRNTPSA